MKPLRSQDLKKARINPRQTSGNEILLQKIQSRKRGLKNPRVVARKYKVILKIITCFVLLAIGFFFLYKYVYLNPVYQVSNIEIVGPYKYVSSTDVREVSEKNLIGKIIFSVNPKDIEKTLKDIFLGAKSVSVSKSYPNKILVAIEERVPVAIVVSSHDLENYLIDVDGYVLGAVSDEFMSMPKIVYDRGVKIGDFIGDSVVPVCVAILKEAQKSGLEVSSVSYSERQSVIFLEGTEVLISNKKNIRDSISVLAKVYNTLKIEGKMVKKIDLRYDYVSVL